MYMCHYQNKQREEREESKKNRAFDINMYFKVITIADNNAVCYACFDSLLPS